MWPRCWAWTLRPSVCNLAFTGLENAHTCSTVSIRRRTFSLQWKATRRASAARTSSPHLAPTSEGRTTRAFAPALHHRHQHRQLGLWAAAPPVQSALGTGTAAIPQRNPPAKETLRVGTNTSIRPRSHEQGRHLSTWRSLSIYLSLAARVRSPLLSGPRTFIDRSPDIHCVSRVVVSWPRGTGMVAPQQC